jgi:hypothetical protein
MIMFRCCVGAWSAAGIILGQVLRTSARSTPAAAINNILHSRGAFYYNAVFSSSQTSKSMSMSKPNSILWTQCRLGALYEAHQNGAFVSTFDAVFSPSCEVRVNHTPSTVDTFKGSISSHRATGAGVTLLGECNHDR